MINRIFKYRIPANGKINMPTDARILTAQTQNGEIHIWAEVVETNPWEPRKFGILGTGHHFDPTALRYIATVQIGVHVWHVYEDFTLSVQENNTQKT